MSRPRIVIETYYCEFLVVKLDDQIIHVAAIHDQPIKRAILTAINHIKMMAIDHKLMNSNIIYSRDANMSYEISELEHFIEKANKVNNNE